MNPLPPPTTSPPADLGALLRLVEAGLLCAPRQSREIASALRSLGVWLHTPLDHLPSDPAAIRRHLAGLHPETVGVLPARFANVKSLLNRALTLAGVKPANRPVAEALSPPWADLFLKLRAEPYLRSSLAPFARFCTASGIPPNGLSETVSSAYLDRLERVSLVKKPATTHQTVCRAWEQARSRIPGWPDIRLTVPCYSAMYTLALSAFPASFRADLDAYLGRLGCDDVADLLDPTAPMRPLKPSSIKTKRYQIRQFASALVLTGSPVEDITSLTVLTKPEHFRKGLRFFINRDRVDKANTRTAGMIAHTIRSIAKYHVRLSAPELDGFNSIVSRLTSRQVGMTEKNRQRLTQFSDQRVTARFICFPPGEIRRLLRAGVRTRAQAVQFSLMLALEVLIHAPMRVGNLAGLRIDRDIRFPRQRDGHTVVLIPRNLVKNGEPLEYRLPPEVTLILSTYIESVRPMLESKPSPFLFPGSGGRAKRADTLSKQITRLVKTELGIEFSPHLIRHLMAMLHGVERPGDYESPRRLLGHRDYNTTYNSYQGMETASANKLHAALIAERRETVSPLPHVRNPTFRKPQAGSIRRKRKLGSLHGALGAFRAG